MPLRNRSIRPLTSSVPLRPTQISSAPPYPSSGGPCCRHFIADTKWTKATKATNHAAL